MIAYTMVGTLDLARARAFYDPLCNRMSMAVCWADAQSVAYGEPDDLTVPRFFVGYPFDGASASIGNGVMTAFQFPSSEDVDALYGIAMQQGGSDEGPPGFRPQYGEGFYAAYVRDPDGNKLAFVMYAA